MRGVGHASKLVDLAVPQDQGTGKKRTPCGCVQLLWGSSLEHAERCDGREPGSPRTKGRAQQAGGSHPRMLTARCTGKGQPCLLQGPEVAHAERHF